MTNDTVLEIVEKVLRESDYDGLFDLYGCGCRRDDIAPCGEMHQDCTAGYLQKCGVCIGSNKDGDDCGCQGEN